MYRYKYGYRYILMDNGMSKKYCFHDLSKMKKGAIHFLTVMETQISQVVYFKHIHMVLWNVTVAEKSSGL